MALAVLSDEEIVDKIDRNPTRIDTISSMEDAKRTYVLMRQEQRNAEVYQLNLQKKMQSLSALLESRTGDVEQLQRNLQYELRKKEDEFDSALRERQYKATAQDERIRDYLGEALFARPEAGVRAPADELDTVMVSFVKSTVYRFNLAFRVDRATTVQELRHSACRYWSIVPEEHVLRTLAGSKCQDGLLVAECFKQGEIAQLRLGQKRREPSERPTDDELKAIQPKQLKKSRKRQARSAQYDAAGVSGIQKQHENHAMELKKMGGTYLLLKAPAGKPSEHCAKIKLRDIVVYSALAVLTAWSYVARRPVGADFWLRRGFEEYLMQEQYSDDGSWLPGFQNVSNREDLWRWLGESLPRSIFPREHTQNLVSHNAMLGYLNIRVQSVRSPRTPAEFCTNNKQVVEGLASAGAYCAHERVTEESQETAELTSLKAYWDAAVAAEEDFQRPWRLRGPTKPYQWASAAHNWAEHGIAGSAGALQSYDASGYSAEWYLLAQGNVTEGFQQDLAGLRDGGWISEQTRAVVVSFTAYNYDYDKWVACELLFELPPSGAITRSYAILPFRPKVFETKAEQTEAYTDYARVLIAFYILTVVGVAERAHKIKNHKAGCWYHVSLNGICDLGIVGCVIGATIWRFTLSTTSSKDFMIQANDLYGTKGFTSFLWRARAYNNVYCVEGLLAVFLTTRLISFLRLSRTMYLLWHVMGTAFKSFLYFTVMFVPTFVGCVFVMHRVYGIYLDDYSTVTDSVFQIYKLLEGQLDMTAPMRVDMVWAMVTMVVFYVVVRCLLLNAFVAIVVGSYYTVMLTTGKQSEKWSDMKRLRWMFPITVANALQALMPSASGEST